MKFVIAAIMGIIFIIAFPIIQHLDYRRDCKKYGKESADAIRDRFW